jgi:D-3-phosphoglycerate dehydrogenase
MIRILSTHPIHPSAEARIRAVGDLAIASALDPETLLAEGHDADIVVVRAPIPEPLIRSAPRLRAAIRHGAGVDMIPLDAATAAGVLVANCPGSNAVSVAEYAVMAMLMVLRRIRAIDADLRQRGWLEGRAHAERTQELAGRTLGLVGFGAVGQAIARLAAGFGPGKVMAATRSRRDLGPGIEPADLDALLAESDIIVLAVPLGRETAGLIDRRRLGLMRPGAVLVNVARGPVVDEPALLDALRSGGLGGAALDVVSSQPLAPDHPLLSLPNVVLTPHLAGITQESMARMGAMVADAVEAILAGGLPAHLVNPDAVAAYRRRFG